MVQAWSDVGRVGSPSNSFFRFLGCTDVQNELEIIGFHPWRHDSVSRGEYKPDKAIHLEHLGLHLSAPFHSV